MPTNECFSTVIHTEVSSQCVNRNIIQLNRLQDPKPWNQSSQIIDIVSFLWKSIRYCKTLLNALVYKSISWHTTKNWWTIMIFQWRWKTIISIDDTAWNIDTGKTWKARVAITNICHAQILFLIWISFLLSCVVLRNVMNVFCLDKRNCVHCCLNLQ